jgi:hypothetical protein
VYARNIRYSLSISLWFTLDPPSRIILDFIVLISGLQGRHLKATDPRILVSGWFSLDTLVFSEHEPRDAGKSTRRSGEQPDAISILGR